jgi:hypothetical protein
MAPIEELVQQTWPGTPVIPYMGQAAPTASRFATSVFQSMRSERSSLIRETFVRTASTSASVWRSSTTLSSSGTGC